MGHFLVDLLPVLLFFIAFKYYGIYVATWVGIFSTVAQVLFCRYSQKKWDKMQLLTLGIFVLFGGMTLYFHNPIFVKWKPTILFWLFALVFGGSHFIGQKPLMARMLELSFNKQRAATQAGRPIMGDLLPRAVGQKLNLAWVLFFIVLGSANLYVAYYFDDQVWVNFKLYGITTATLVFSVVQTVYLAKYLKV